MTDHARQRHSELLLAAIHCEAHSARLSDAAFRKYVRELTSNLDLPDPFLKAVPDAA